VQNVWLARAAPRPITDEDAHPAPMKLARSHHICHPLPTLIAGSARPFGPEARLEWAEGSRSLACAQPCDVVLLLAAWTPFGARLLGGRGGTKPGRASSCCCSVFSHLGTHLCPHDQVTLAKGHSYVWSNTDALGDLDTRAGAPRPGGPGTSEAAGGSPPGRPQRRRALRLHRPSLLPPGVDGPRRPALAAGLLQRRRVPLGAERTPHPRAAQAAHAQHVEIQGLVRRLRNGEHPRLGSLPHQELQALGLHALAVLLRPHEAHRHLADDRDHTKRTVTWPTTATT